MHSGHYLDIASRPYDPPETEAPLCPPPLLLIGLSVGAGQPLLHVTLESLAKEYVFSLCLCFDYTPVNLIKINHLKIHISPQQICPILDDGPYEVLWLWHRIVTIPIGHVTV